MSFKLCKSTFTNLFRWSAVHQPTDNNQAFSIHTLNTKYMMCLSVRTWRKKQSFLSFFSLCFNGITCELFKLMRVTPSGKETLGSIKTKGVAFVGGCCCAAWFQQMNNMPIGHRSKLCDLSQMSLLPTENHNLIIQTCVEKEPEPCEIKINDKRKKKNMLVQYGTFSATKKDYLQQKDQCKTMS